MAERDHYDFSALAPDIDFGDDSMPVLDPHHELALAEELESADDFDANFDAMASEAAVAWPDPTEDADFRELQLALRLLQDGLVDLQLEAEEAWLEALMLEEGAGEAQAPGEPAPAFSFGDLAALDEDW